MSTGNSSLSNGIDHLVYACANLERGMDEIEQLLGVRPAPGGRHPDFGTHNALLSLGPETYLEVISRDPDSTISVPSALAELPDDQISRLNTWVLRTEDIDQLAGIANAAGIDIGLVQSGSRDAPDGSKISWQLTDHNAMPMGGAIPFLINWGDTPHPASMVPSGGEIINLTIEHPEVNRVREMLSVLGVDIAVVHSQTFKLVAKIQTSDGFKLVS
jgi:hypothetical protein